MKMIIIRNRNGRTEYLEEIEVEKDTRIVTWTNAPTHAKIMTKSEILDNQEIYDPLFQVKREALPEIREAKDILTKEQIRAAELFQIERIAMRKAEAKEKKKQRDQLQKMIFHTRMLDTKEPKNRKERRM